jgi:putative FmdB family regulatory protein
MPFYEYECSSCKFYTEVMQKISDAPLTKCPSCGRKALKKLVSAPVFRLKGAGWYETDFKSDKENKRNLAGAEREDSATKAQSEAAPAKAAETPKSEPKADSGSAAKPSSPPAAKAASSGESHSRRSPRAAKSAARTTSAGSKSRSAQRGKPTRRKKAGR